MRAGIQALSALRRRRATWTALLSVREIALAT
jgi:hypothetical protein